MGAPSDSYTACRTLTWEVEIDDQKRDKGVSHRQAEARRIAEARPVLRHIPAATVDKEGFGDLAAEEAQGSVGERAQGKDPED